MPIARVPADGGVVRQRKSCCNSPRLGCLKLQTSQPLGSTPDMTCWMGAVLAGSVHPPEKSAATHSGWTRSERRCSELNSLMCSPGLLYTVLFDVQRLHLVGHSLRLTFSPGRTRKSFELIFIFILSAMSAALFASVLFMEFIFPNLALRLSPSPD